MYEVGWLIARVANGLLVILAGLLIFRDGANSLAPGLMMVIGLTLIILGVGSIMWGVHLTIVSGDIKNVMILYGNSLRVQGIASVVGMGEGQPA